jgi:hypothetical protein
MESTPSRKISCTTIVMRAKSIVDYLALKLPGDHDAPAWYQISGDG